MLFKAHPSTDISDGAGATSCHTTIFFFFTVPGSGILVHHINNHPSKKGRHNMEQIPAYILLGIMAGVLSGLVGIGGGIIIVPALVILFGFSQHTAQGTTIALMVPPIGILAAWAYYTRGYVDLTAAALICAGFLFGGYFGAKLAISLPKFYLQKIFGIALLLISLKMLFSK
jgi:uncharacterized membrane protein YfcA